MPQNTPNNQKNKYPPNRKGPQQQNNWFFWIMIGFFALILLSQNDEGFHTAGNKKISYSKFYSDLRTNHETGVIKKLELVESTENKLNGTYSDNSTFTVIIPQEDEALLDLIRNNVDDFSVVPAQVFWSQMFFSFMPIIIILFFIWFISNRGSQMGNKIWSFGKSRAKVNEKGDQKITFKNVAGVDEAKEELQEVIEFLKSPLKFEKLGGKIPKGVLLVGPPGTGKTLLAKAVAGEAGVPFFSLSGSDFVEMFVGVGASRVRDLFEQGRKASKTSGKGAIIFIDEIDAVGRQRFTGIGGGNDEREQTLNALLVEMDGFNTTGGLILIAATNRPDTLDPALLRPGRFDRRITVGLPDIDGREGILKVHSKKIKLDKEVNLRRIAQMTVYFSGADLANVCNEAALLAARHDRTSIKMNDFLASVERVTMGPEKKSRVVSQKEKEMTAYHEAGHALLSLLIDEVDTFTKVSIIPRGMAGGYTLTPPTEDKHYYNKSELQGQMVVLLGGLVGEEIFIGDTSTGVSNDLERATEIARNMICVYGMSETLGPMAFAQHPGQNFLGRDLMEQKPYSEATAKQIDEEIKKFVNQSLAKARELLTSHYEQLEKIANRLIEKEVIDIEESLVILNMQEKSNSSSSEKSDNPET